MTADKLVTHQSMTLQAGILTHCYWLSILDSYLVRFSGVNISDGAIIGYHSLIVMGPTVGRNGVIGAQSIVSKDIEISPRISLDYPFINVNDCRFNVEELTFEGNEDRDTDDFRDYVRKRGLRFYSDRPFRSVWTW